MSLRIGDVAPDFEADAAQGDEACCVIAQLGILAMTTFSR